MDVNEWKSGRGFTLIELLIAVAVAAILAALAYPSFSGLMGKTRRSEGRAALLQAMQQQERYYTLNNSYAGFSRSDPQGFRWHSAEGPQRSAYELSASACDGETLRTCVRVEARPATDAVNTGARDELCGTLSLDSRGGRGAEGDPARCWQ
ncbi:type IV pilin protein [Lacisediminimonas profundi]|uniref:type IV pilin protein n=1 Tax=Lacisediminimonas profundi TaxID=2603856 RepID=UPI001F4F508C|nr:type IV pilin protein [Lacisediminimonas profundi]